MARPRQITDEQILSTMRQSVLEHGPAVALDVVAAELGVTSPALLKRFGNRQALLVAALRPDQNPEWIEVLERGPGEAPLEEQLVDVFTRISNFMAEVVPCMTALRESGINIASIYKKPSGPERGLKALRRWLVQAKAAGLVTATELETSAFAMLGALQTRAFFSHILQRPLTPRVQREYVEELARLFCRSLAPKKPTR